MESVKITVVGDHSVGKTSMLFTYTTGAFRGEYMPRVFDHYGEEITVDGRGYNMILVNTAGQEDYERTRPLFYPDTSCFLVCFSVKKYGSYNNVVTKWAPELSNLSPKVPIVLLATKTDLRDDPSIACYTPEEGNELKRKINAQSYMECSALRNEGLKEVFIEAIRVHRKSKNKKSASKQCNVA